MPAHLEFKPFVEFGTVRFDRVCAYLVEKENSDLVSEAHLLGLGVCPSNGDMEIPLNFYSYGTDRLEEVLRTTVQTNDAKSLLFVIKRTAKPLQL